MAKRAHISVVASRGRPKKGSCEHILPISSFLDQIWAELEREKYKTSFAVSYRASKTSKLIQTRLKNYDRLSSDNDLCTGTSKVVSLFHSLFVSVSSGVLLKMKIPVMPS